VGRGLENQAALLILHDGQNLFDPDRAHRPGHTWQVAETAATLIEEGRIPPVVIAGIDHAEEARLLEMTPTEGNRPGAGQAARYGRFIVEELMPFLEAEYHVDTRAGSLALGGSSLGSNSLLLACKQVFEAKDPLRIFTVPIADGKPTGMTWADIPAAEIAARLNGKKVRPSAIALDPQTGNRLLLAANHAALINLAPDGSLIDAIILPGKSRHQQAEGIAISTDGLLLVADEGGDGRARLAVYAWTGNGLELQ
jgi:hypothetical protein